MRFMYARHLVTTSVLVALTLSGCSSLSKKSDGDGQSATAAVTATNTPDSSSSDAVAASNNTQNGNGTKTGSTGNAVRSTAELLAARIVHFGFDDAAVSRADYDVLNAHAQWLATHKKARIEISGHTDERGTPEYNMALGEKRAKAVAAYLRTHGVAAGNIKDIVSFGETKPVNTDSSEAAWAENRRVEITYLKDAP